MMSSRSAARAACACTVVLCVSLAIPAAAQTKLGSDIIDPEFGHDGFACWQTTKFMISAVNMTTGALTGPTVVLDTPAASLRDAHNGPEILRTATGTECVGTALAGGLFRYDASGGYIVPGTEGLYGPITPEHDLCPSVRYNAYDSDGRTFLIDGDTPRSEPVDGTVMRWLSCDEIVVRKSPGYKVVNIDTGATTFVTDKDYNIFQGYALTTSSGEQLIVFTNDTQVDLYRHGLSGWYLDPTPIKSPDSTLPYLYSFELVEWQERPFVSGFIAKSGGMSQSKAFIHDIDNNKGQLIGKGAVFYKDPEVLPLMNGKLAVYVWVLGEGTTRYFVINPN